MVIATRFMLTCCVLSICICSAASGAGPPAPCEVDPGLCDDDNACTIDICLPDEPGSDVNGCVHNPVPSGLPCYADEDFCTVEQCDGDGLCVYVYTTECIPSFDPCWYEVCNPDKGSCETVFIDGPCDDDDACTQDDVCVQYSCIGTPIGPCDPVPDGCDALEDCNGNRTADACDIDMRTSLDCNINGVPDECDVADGTSQDCNGNLTPDECELAEIDPSPVQALNTNAPVDDGDDGPSRVAADGLGNWLVAWQSNGDLGGTIGTDEDLLYARSIDNGLTWTAPAVLNSYADVDDAQEGPVKLKSNSAGLWLAVWRSKYDLGGIIGTDWDILFARSEDAGLTWSAAAVLNTTAATDGSGFLADDDSPHIATNHAGCWICVWGSRVNPTAALVTRSKRLESIV